MEGAGLRKSGGHDGGVLLVKEDQRVESNGDGEGSSKDETNIVLKVGGGGKDIYSDNMKPSSPELKDFSHGKKVPLLTKMERSSGEPNSRASSSSQKDQDDQLESAKAEIGEIREENQRLRMYLDQIMKDYQTLQMQFNNIVGQEEEPNNKLKKSQDHQEADESELVSLSLGRTSKTKPQDDDQKHIKSPSSKGKEMGLGLVDFKFDNDQLPNMGAPSDDQNHSSVNPSPEVSMEGGRGKEEGGESRANKGVKTMRSSSGGEDDDDDAQLNPVKKARVSVRVRCDTPTMNDGCQWRKYGQKIAKGNPCPRAYYRCTVAPSCPVRKQVQRCAEDMSILITTYEGTHNHPLPISATAMASTTSAAASMLLSGSSSSSSKQGGPTPSPPPLHHHNLHGLDFYLSGHDYSKSNQYYLPLHSSSSSSSIPSSSPYSTITLDLTTTTSSSSSSSTSHFIKTSPNFPPLVPQRYSSTNLNFSSLESNPLPISWSNNALSYGISTQPLTRNLNNSSLNFGRQVTQDQNYYQPFMQKSGGTLCNTTSTIASTSTPLQQSLPQDTIAAATKAITSDPTFQSALTAALASLIGSNGGGGKYGQNLKLGDEPFSVVNSLLSASSTSNANKLCSSSYMNRPPSTTNSQPGSLMFMQPPLPMFSTSKSKSSSPAGDHTADQSL